GRFERMVGPWVELPRLEQTNTRSAERYDLSFLLTERDPSWKGSPRCDDIDDPRLPTFLNELAEKLRQFGSDVLRGDFSIFPQLKRRAEENLRRTDKELFGVDQP